MKKGLIFLISVILFWGLANCSNSKTGSSCRNSCSEKTGLCILAVNGNSTPNTNNTLICEIYSIDCNSSCGSTRSSSSSSKSSSSSRSSSSSSSSGSHSSSGGSSSSGSGSSGGSSGSSHEILGNFKGN